jgi:hypothetical protein
MNKGSFRRSGAHNNLKIQGKPWPAKRRFQIIQIAVLTAGGQIMTNKMKILPALALAAAMAITGAATPALAAHGGGFHGGGGGFHGGGFHGGGFHGGFRGGGLGGFGAGLALGGLGWGYPYYGYYDYPYYGGYGACVPHRYWWHGYWHWRAC